MKKKVLFVIDEMTMGGVSRITNTFLKMIDRGQYDVDLLVLHKRGEMLSEVPEWVNVIGGSSFFNTVDIPIKSCSFPQLLSKARLLLYMKTGLIKNRIRVERKNILSKQYDIEFSTKEGFCTIFTAYGDSKRKLNWIQVDYKVSNYSRNHMGLVKDALQYIDTNIACSETVKDSYSEVFGISNIQVVHNLIDDHMIRDLSGRETGVIEESDKINLIAVARFHYQKALDRLIRVYAKYESYYNLTIVGDGEEKDNLYQLARDLGVYDKIKWTGILSNPYPMIKESDLFVMTSLYEGYPTITVESLLCGTPVLTVEVAGVKEQITEKQYGWVIENDDTALDEAFDYLKDKKSLLKEYKGQLQRYDYGNTEILNRYYDAFNGN